MDNTQFINELIHKGNYGLNLDNKDNEMMLVIKLYQNGFRVVLTQKNNNISGNSNDSNVDQFYSFSNENNKEIFAKIKRKIFPKEIINDKINKAFHKEIECVVIEDYSDVNYVYINTKEETTEIIIKLINGNIIKKEFNLYHTIRDIKQIIENEVSEYKGKKFTFVYGYPPCTIDTIDFDKTIDDFGFQNVSLIQRLL